MKKLFKFTFCLFLITNLGVLASCEKEDTTEDNNEPAKPTTATLIVNVSESYSPTNTQTAVNPKVQLFPTLQDRQNKTNPLTDLIEGDESGNVKFEKLEAKVYYFNAFNNSMTMSNATTGGTTNTLVIGQETKVNTIVKQ